MNRLFYFCTMDQKLVRRNLVLGILFFLPVVFLLFLFPAKHHYNTLDVVHDNVSEITGFTADSQQDIVLKDHITVLGFLGDHPMERLIGTSNIKELIYDKFKGFKKFQVVMVAPKGTESEVKELKSQINTYEEMTYWHYVFADKEAIQHLFNSLGTSTKLDGTLATNQIFIIDKELKQRGRLDDRTDPERSANKPIYSLTSYNCLEVSEIKNKMSEDVRILFTEYRQKRRGNFDSSTRRANQLKGIEED